MLNIFAEALMLATRSEPFRPAEPRLRNDQMADGRVRRGWFVLSGLPR